MATTLANAVAVALLAVGAQAQPPVSVRVVDALTGVTVDGAAVAVTRAGGRTEVRVSAGGYRPLAAVFDSTVAGVPVTFELDPLQPRAIVSAAPGTSIVHGYVVDAVSARVVSGATVALPDRGQATTTDANGYFRFVLPEPAAGEEARALTRLRITAPGYGAHEVTGLLIAPGATLLRERLTPGQEPTARDDAPHALRVSGAGRSGSAGRAGEARPAAEAADEWATLVPIEPPASIRVGTSCSCTTCAAVSVLSLETYVKRGLNDEWIASWNAQALRAGAVAYRAYGTWYTRHPISGTYDICSTTCCQVNDTDTSSATDAAADRTAGFLLERGAAVFRAEYSAENNAWDDPDDVLSCTNADLSCGDGSAGSPGTGWSCLADGVDAGQGCFGHGRGACQWGTQRWALQGRRWNWILDHYYNDHGAGTGQRTAHISTPLVLLQAQAPPRVGRGTRFTVSALAGNRAEATHARVLLGASLRRGGEVVSDPAHDAALVLPPGDSDVSREFDVRFSTGAGTYDLLVSLYDDVNEDGAITGGIDLPLQLLVRPAAVEVCTSPFCPVRPGR